MIPSYQSDLTKLQAESGKETEKEYVQIPSESSFLDVSLEQGQRTPLVLLLTWRLTSLRDRQRDGHVSWVEECDWKTRSWGTATAFCLLGLQ